MRPVEASYEDGFLKPAQPLKLRQGEKVAVIVLRRPDPTRWDRKRLAAGVTEDEALAAAGLDAWADALDGEDRR
ncbi:MAG TPA: antitoxin family protein [Polyangiaceae bacterium]|jgi:predicted DNA-binding antitoxin AbrB/MazE fold protein|nr:antitoxin family protein [Polyangiaceae bacterium]